MIATARKRDHSYRWRNDDFCKSVHFQPEEIICLICTTDRLHALLPAKEGHKGTRQMTETYQGTPSR